MADFALWATAAEEALGFRSGGFMSAYAGNRAEAVQETLESDPVSAAIAALIDNEKREGSWTGTSGNLLKDLAGIVDDVVKKSPAWPRSPRGLSGHVRRLATFMRESGIEITYRPKGTGGQRLVTIARIALPFTASTATTASAETIESMNPLVTTEFASGGWPSGEADGPRGGGQPPLEPPVQIPLNAQRIGPSAAEVAVACAPAPKPSFGDNETVQNVLQASAKVPEAR
jgi:hypothetical protein